MKKPSTFGSRQATQKLQELDQEYRQTKSYLAQGLQVDSENYSKLLSQCAALLEEEAKCNLPLVALEKEWLDCKDHHPENAVFVETTLSQYMLYTLMGMAGQVHKMWYGFKNPGKFEEEVKDQQHIEELDGKSYDQGKYVASLSESEQVVRP